ncbi:peptidyl-tRNA hydrolase [Kribbella sp. NPDC003557]|uniref:peptidyl-tRNA hydrolase n=1 Tax=Kribbella sp. NPDC003557 TaxID=3154449 RepID=UPI0033A5824F
MELVLTLVVRVEKKARPAQTDALETAARAVLAILADERSHGEGEWAEAMAAWQDNRIRKITKRARGIEWRRAEALPGITVRGYGTGSSVPAEDVAPSGAAASGAAASEAPASGAPASGAPASEAPASGVAAAGAVASGVVAAEVRVFPPTGVDDVPPDLFKLQVSGTDFEDTADLPPLDPGVPVLWLNPTLEMSSGKAMAQCGHAAQLAWWGLSERARKEWEATGFELAVRTATPEHWRSLLTSNLPVVQDAGFTEIAPGSRTVIADHPQLRR